MFCVVRFPPLVICLLVLKFYHGETTNFINCVIIDFSVSEMLFDHCHIQLLPVFGLL